MTDRRIRVSRSLYLSALTDAIDWTESLVASQGDHPNIPDVVRLRRYRDAYAAAGGQPEPEPGPGIPLHLVKENWPHDGKGKKE